MKRQPLVMALVTVGAIFIFFLFIALVLHRLTGHRAKIALGEKVAVVEIFGVIESSDKIIENLNDFVDDGSVKAIVLRIDSPGGGVAPSQEIFEEVKKADEIKPVVVSMASVAASGGYYVAAPARKIVANPGTITGSIGVIMEFSNYEELLKKVGWRNEVVKSGRFKDIGSPNRSMTDDDRRVLMDLIDDVQDQFINAVAEGRKLDVKTVRDLADGRIFTGRQAKTLGLVDELGNLEDSIDLAANLAGIEDPAVVYPKPDKPRFFDYLIDETVTQLHRGLREETASKINFLWTGPQ